MTTIAWDGRTLAADSRSASNDVVMSDRHTKVVRVGNVLAAATGTAARCREFLAWVGAGMPGDPPANPHPADKDWSYWGLVIAPHGAWVFQEPGIVPVTSPYYAMGTGRDFALGAMAVGASATEAVRAAMRHDTCSGGDVTVLSVR